MEPTDKGNICKESVFKSLFDSLANDLFKFLYYKFGEENNPEDVVQEAFLKLWKNCSRIPPDKAKSFLFTVANNQMLNELSKKKTTLKYKENPPKIDSETPQFIIEEKEYMEKLKDALQSLTPDQRVTFMLNRVEGKRHKEIAEMLGISRKAVEKRIYKALKIIQEKIGDFKI